jgi:hypothetical protein
MKAAALAVGMILSLTTGALAAEVVAAGDIATSGPGDTQTADRVRALGPDLVLTLGDNAYPSGSLHQFIRYYDPTWGRFKGITQPSPGNHEWLTEGAGGYEGYFGVRAGRVRSFTVGRWRVVSMDSTRNIAPQRMALASVLRRDRHRCELLYFHHPRWSSGTRGNEQHVAPWWRTAYSNGVDVILNGHAHNYERFAKKAPTGAWDPRGIREFVVGTGGAPTSSFGSIEPGSQKRITGNEHWGVLVLRLTTSSYRWRYVDADSGAALDSGTTNCHR